MSQHRETAVAAVTGEAHDHRRQTDGEREASHKFDIHAEQQDEGRNKQLPSRNAEKRGDDPIDEASRQSRDELEIASCESLPARVRITAEQQKGGDAHKQGAVTR